MNPEVIIKSDLRNIHELQPDDWPDIVPSFKFYFKSSFCKPMKIEIENRIAGIGAGNSLGKTGWLSHIITRPEFRNRGIAGLIVNHLRNLLIKTGCETVSLIATESGFPVYKKAGFSLQSEYVFFERKEPLISFNKPQNIVHFSDKYKYDILALDKKISGEDRSRLLAEKFKNSYLYLEDGTLTGYYIPRLGEGFIAADNPQAGIELTKLRCSVSNRCVLPGENHEGIAFLKSHGYAEIKKARRMIYGKEFVWHPEKIFSRVAGNFG